MIPNLRRGITVEYALNLMDQVQNPRFRRGARRYFAPNGNFTEKSIYWFYPWIRRQIEYNNKDTFEHTLKIWNEIFDKPPDIFNDDPFYSHSKKERYRRNNVNQ
jgi:hypothetical protein